MAGNEVKFRFQPGEQEITSLAGRKPTTEQQQTLNLNTEGIKEPEKPKQDVVAKENIEKSEPPKETKTEGQEAQKAVTTDQRPEESKTSQASEQPTKQEAKEINDSTLLEFYNKKYNTQFKSLEELQQVKEVEKVIEKEPELDDEVAAFANFKKETGRGLQDYLMLNKDFGKMSEMDLARDAIRIENEGMNLSESDITLLLTEKLGVDSEDLSELEGRELLRLKSIANKHLKYLKSEQDKYKKPLENKEKTQEQKPQPSGETIQLSNGQVIEKAVYEQQRKDYLQQRDNAVNSLEKALFEIQIDEDGEKVNVPFNYNYTNEDKQRMLSLTEDVSGLLPRYQSENGFDHKKFNEDLWWSVPENREKAIKAMLNHARSNGIYEVVKEERNINFKQQTKPAEKPKAKEGYANHKLEDYIRRQGEGYGVKFGLSNT